MIVGACLLTGVSGCTRIVKGPVGQGERGVGLRVPVLDLFESDTYDPELYSADDLDEEQLEPFGTQPESQRLEDIPSEQAFNETRNRF